MHVRASLIALIALGAATPAFAGTKLQLNILPTPPDCFVGGACLNSGVACLDIGGNTDCIAAGVSPKSKVSLDGKLALKGSLQGVVDNGGSPVTTGAEGAVDNYVLQVGLQTCTPDTTEVPYCTAIHDVYVKVVLKNGKGTIKVDLNPVFSGSFTPGTAFRVNHVALITPRGGGMCLGTNSTVDITARLNDGTCNDGIGILGVGGVQLQ
jgi:hypothetical protein